MNTYEMTMILGIFQVGMAGLFICCISARKARFYAARAAHWLDRRAAKSAAMIAEREAIRARCKFILKD